MSAEGIKGFSSTGNNGPDLPCAGYPATVDGVYDCYSGSVLAALRIGIPADSELPGRLAAALLPAVGGGEVSGRYLLDEASAARLRTPASDRLESAPRAGRRVRLRLPEVLPGGPRTLQAALDRLREQKEVALQTAYAERAVWGGPPMLPAAFCAGSSDYLRGAPLGIGALHIWARGFTGQGVRLADVEAGWRLPHEDLDPGKIQPIYNQSNTAEAGHGTGVLGILMASSNGVGGTGVVYGIDHVLLASHFERGKGCSHVPEAIHAAIANLRAGDILLLEVQTVGRGYPAETDSATFDAIKSAVASGITVVEAAGDAGHSIDELLDEESGALIVGAGEAALSSAVASALNCPDQKGSHRYQQGSNYGKRVHCYAWGDGILTTGVPGRSPDGVQLQPPERSYRCDFTSTSAAAAIIAGAAALLQSVWRHETGGNTLLPKDLRALFSTCGTPQSDSDPDQLIGVMPDLERILREHGP